MGARRYGSRMPGEMIAFAFATLALFGWLAVTWRRAEASAKELERAREVIGSLIAELRRSQGDILELQTRVDRLDGGVEPESLRSPVRE